MITIHGFGADYLVKSIKVGQITWFSIGAGVCLPMTPVLPSAGRFNRRTTAGHIQRETTVHAARGIRTVSTHCLHGPGVSNRLDALLIRYWPGVSNRLDALLIRYWPIVSSNTCNYQVLINPELYIRPGGHKSCILDPDGTQTAPTSI
jgi:hypothetical protein